MPAIICCQRWLIILLVFACACTSSYKIPDFEQRAHKLNKTIMCPVCPGEAIDQSQHVLATQMRNIVLEKISEGWSDDEVREFFVSRYGPSVLLEPPRNGFNMMAWILPPSALLILLVTSLIVLGKMKNKSRVIAGDKTAVSSFLNEELAEYMDSIEESLRDKK